VERLEKVEYGERFRLSSGREFESVSTIIGLGFRDDNVYTGHDDSIEVAGAFAEFGGDSAWSDDEKRELADFMIARWQAWRPK
jgi:hypothetical protein